MVNVYDVSYFIYKLRKHLENSKVGLETPGFFFFQKSGNPEKLCILFAL